MVRAVRVDYIVISAFLGNSHDLYQEKWYISATLLLFNLFVGARMGVKE